MKSATVGLENQGPDLSELPVIPSLKEAVSMYMETITDLDDLSPNTLKHYEHDLELFVRFVHRYTSQSEVFVDTITPQHIEAFVQLMQGRRNAPSSQRRRMTALRRFFERMVSWGYIDAAPTDHLKTIIEKSKTPVILTKRECIQLLEGTKTTRNPLRDHAIFRLFLVTACTLSELIKLQKRDVNLDRRTIRFRGRRNATRIIRMSPETRDVLSAYLAYRDKAPAHPHALFINRLGQPVTKGAIYHAFQLVLDATNINKPGVSIHSLRHTSLAILWQSGVSIHVLQQIAGHKCIATTRSYSWAGARPNVPRPWQWIHPLEDYFKGIKLDPYSDPMTGFSKAPMRSISHTMVSPGFK